MTHLVNLVINRRVFLNVSIGGGKVSFRLIIIVIADEVADVIVREKAFELCGKLSRQSFVVRNDERRKLDALNNFCNGVSFARARRAK